MVGTNSSLRTRGHVGCWVEFHPASLSEGWYCLYHFTASSMNRCINTYLSLGPFYLHGLIWVSAWISNYIHFKVWGEMTYPFPNFNGCTVEVWEWISNFMPHFIGHVITYPCWDLYNHASAVAIGLDAQRHLGFRNAYTPYASVIVHHWFRLGIVTHQTPNHYHNWYQLLIYAS